MQRIVTLAVALTSFCVLGVDGYPEERLDKNRSPVIWIEGNGGEAYVMHGPGFPKSRITDRDIERLVTFNPKNISFDSAVIDKSAKQKIAELSSANVSIGELSKLESLTLQRINLSDDDLKLFRKCRHLKFANLMDSDVTDDSIVILSEFEKLKRVYLVNTAVTIQGAQQLRMLRPDMDVVMILPVMPRFREIERIK